MVIMDKIRKDMGLVYPADSKGAEKQTSSSDHLALVLVRVVEFKNSPFRARARLPR
ncbi:hypothetical protein PC112_g18932 [Phytophthora cactorum]|nr:hypothetical protein PC112_g18932 [Phytophthora cactorum]KAG3177663.1 hypothetical protein C6341_g8371 [Phytophthora cactorum]